MTQVMFTEQEVCSQHGNTFFSKQKRVVIVVAVLSPTSFRDSLCSRAQIAFSFLPFPLFSSPDCTLPTLRILPPSLSASEKRHLGTCYVGCKKSRAEDVIFWPKRLIPIRGNFVRLHSAQTRWRKSDVLSYITLSIVVVRATFGQHKRYEF